MRRTLTILVTGGPTRAYLDDVRYLSNLSSGELAYEICRELRQKKMRVVSVIGPTHFAFEKLGVEHHSVETYEQMRKAVLSACRKHQPDFAVFSAAVLDFAPKKSAQGKISSRNRWVIELVPTRKIVDEVGEEFPSIRRVGFKLDVGNRALKTSADRLRRQKGYWAIIANNLRDVSGKEHRAYFVSDRISKRLAGKRRIAKFLADEIRRATL